MDHNRVYIRTTQFKSAVLTRRQPDVWYYALYETVSPIIKIKFHKYK